MSSVQCVELYRYLFNSVELENRTRDGGGGQVVILHVIAGRELVTVRRQRYENGSLVLPVPFKGKDAVLQLPQHNLSPL